MKESNLRSLLKAFSWRIVASLITTCIVFVVTKELVLAFSVGIIDSAVKIAAYFGHERLWMAIPLGKPSHPLSEFKVTQELSEGDKAIIRQKLIDLGYLEG